MRIKWRKLCLVITKGAGLFWIAAAGLVVSGVLGEVLGAKAGLPVNSSAIPHCLAEFGSG